MMEYVCGVENCEYDNTDPSEIGVVGYNNQCDGNNVVLSMTGSVFAYE